MNVIVRQTVVAVIEACLVTTLIVSDNNMWLITHVFQSFRTLICILFVLYCSCSLIFVSKNTRKQWEMKTEIYSMLKLILFLFLFLLLLILLSSVVFNCSSTSIDFNDDCYFFLLQTVSQFNMILHSDSVTCISQSHKNLKVLSWVWAIDCCLDVMSMIEITLIITEFLDCQCLLTVSNHLHKALYFFINLIDFWVLLHCLLIQLYCVEHSILWGQQWILVDSNIILIDLNRGIAHEVQNRRRCEWGSNTLWGCSNRLWGGCFCRFECLLLCRRSLCRGLLFSHDDDNSEVKLGGGGWWKGFFAGFLYILLENFAKWPLTPTF